jgi:hypothetical protein
VKSTRSLQALGDAVRANGEIQELSMEIARVDVERPWFHRELFASRFWKPKLPDQLPLSDGSEPLPQGTLPGYVIGLILVRNISLTWKTAASGASDTSPIYVLGNFALEAEVLNQATQPQIIRPLPGEEIERAVAPVVNPPTVDTVTSTIDLQLVDTSKWAGSITPILRPEALHVVAASPAVSTMLSGRTAVKSSSRVSVLSDETTDS